MSIGKRIRTGGMVLAGAFVLQAAVTLGMERSLAKAIEDEHLMATAIHNHMQADMMHDATRSAVFRTLHGVARGDNAERDSAVGEIDEFSGQMRQSVDANRKLALDADIQAGLSTISGQLSTYSDTARALGQAAQTDPVRAEAMLGEFDTAFRALEASQEAVAEKIEGRMAAVTERAEWLKTASIALLVMLSGIFAAVLFAMLRALDRKVVQPIGDVADRLDRMNQGDFAVALTDPQGQDEVSAIQQAAIAFREAGVARQRSEREQAEVVAALGTGLDALADGDLSHRIDVAFAAEYERLRTSFNRSSQSLSELLAAVLDSASRVSTGASEIRIASDDLARRNQQQAASVEESAAALTQVAGLVRETAAGATGLRTAVSETHREAAAGGAVVARAVEAMAGIERSAHEISQIIGVIDGIAFQTNLLALNAGVEAARAGEAGRGFAVVASEVRALAQRSAEAAQDIKALISTSAQQVSSGVTLVGETGALLEHIVGRVADVSNGIGEIAASAERQASSVRDVSTTVTGMDRVTQQNAAMVEEATAAARSLADEAAALEASVAHFRIGRDSGPQEFMLRRAA